MEELVMIDDGITIQVVNALRNRYEAERTAAVAELMVFVRNPVGVGEHPAIIETADVILTRIAEAETKIATVSKYFRFEEAVPEEDSSSR